MTTMLPAPPKSLGRLGEVLKSSWSAVQGEENSLGFEPKRVICVVMVDGLGYSNLTAAAGHAPFLNSRTSEKSSCYFPATTSTSLSSFATGLEPWSTNFTGYLVYDRDLGQPMNLLSGWSSFEEGSAFQTGKTFSELAVEAGSSFHVVSSAAYKDSGFTGATMRKAQYHPANLVEERFAIARDLLRSERGLIYLYVPELDQTAHAFGSQSTKWLNQLESLDSLVRNLVSSLPKDAAIVLTADHGVVDVAETNHVYLDNFISTENLTYVGGDTRGLQLYLSDAAEQGRFKELLDSQLGDSCYILEPKQLVESGWWGELPDARYLPDLLVLARKSVALYHRDFAKKKSLLMVGHHGSITDAELSVPLMKFNV